jgi:hypothetical protein
MTKVFRMSLAATRPAALPPRFATRSGILFDSSASLTTEVDLACR